MKANELMIGDWVFHEKYGNVLIESIDNDFGDRPSVLVISENIKHKEGYTYGYRWCALEDVFPIPPTPEILEKNFESERNIYGSQTYKLNEDFYLENRKYNFSLVRRCDRGSYSTFWICDIMYVHQLQHVLKLYDIEKEIEL